LTVKPEAFTSVEASAGGSKLFLQRPNLLLPDQKSSALSGWDRASLLTCLDAPVLQALSRSDAVRSRDRLTSWALGW